MIRQLTPEDVLEVHRLELECYLPSLHESADAFIRLIELFPEGAWAYTDEKGLCGYAFGVPLRAGSTLQLRTPLPEVPSDADTFYIHDVAVAQRCRAHGVGRMLVDQLFGIARAAGFTRFELVSVQGSAPFWERFGFRRISDLEYAPGAPSVKMGLTLPH